MARSKKFGAEKHGDWLKVKQMASGMPHRFRSVIKNTLPKVGLKGEKIAVKHMSDQDLGWEPLDAKYLRSKIKKGKSEKILIRDAEYIRSITSVTGGMSVFTGVSKKAKSRSGENLADIAKTHEYGSEARGIPARPLWRPTYEELLNWLKKSKLFAVEIAKDLKRK